MAYLFLVLPPSVSALFGVVTRRWVVAVASGLPLWIVWATLLQIVVVRELEVQRDVVTVRRMFGRTQVVKRGAGARLRRLGDRAGRVMMPDHEMWLLTGSEGRRLLLDSIILDISTVLRYLRETDEPRFERES